MQRSEFLKLSAAAVLLPCVAQAHAKVQSNHRTENNDVTNDSWHYWNKKTRLTISMWDFTWLSDSGKGGSWENLEQRVAEAAERGYNTLRVDCFPSRILEKETSFRKGYQKAEGKFIPVWGRVTTDVTCNALQKMKELADLCRKHDIFLGLASWEKGHMMGQRNFHGLDTENNPIPIHKEEKTLKDFAEVWVKALRLMREEGILERAAWVEPMNEVPHFCSQSLESIIQISGRARQEGEVELDKNQRLNERYKLINTWLGEALKEEISRDGIPLCYSSIGAEEYAKCLPEFYDVVDVHFMPWVITNPEDNREFAEIAKGNPQNFIGWERMDMKRWSEVWDRACRNNYRQMLIRCRDYHETALQNCVFPSGKRMQAVITESFGPVFFPDHPDVSWEWYKHYNGDCARMVAAMPFEGISLSNFAEPLFSLWEHLDWHRNANLFIQNFKK